MGRAVEPRVRHRVLQVEDGPLDGKRRVRVPAKDRRSRLALDLNELLRVETDAGVRRLVPKPVAPFQVLELEGDDASEGRTHDGALQRQLEESPAEQVDVVNVAVGFAEIPDCLQTHERNQLRK